MIHPVARSNRVDGQGRGGTNCGDKNQNNGTLKQQWPNLPRTGKNILKLAKLIDTLFPGILLVLLLIITQANGNPHEPMNWTITNIKYPSNPIQARTTPGTVSFNVSLHDLITEEDRRDEVDICKPIYICPASNPGKGYCNSPGYYYCAYWGCETWASEWSAPGDQYLEIKWSPEGCERPKLHGDRWGHCLSKPIPCVGINITIKNPAQDFWLAGKYWGIRSWETGADRGGIFQIMKRPMPHDPLPIGPNLVLNPPTFSEEKVAPVIVVTPSSDSLLETTNDIVTEFSLSRDLELSESKDPLWNLMQASYRALNESKPNYN